MSRKIAFTVTLEFEDKISDDLEIIEIARNIARAVRNECNSGSGITPEDSETFTKNVSVKPIGFEEVINQNMY